MKVKDIVFFLNKLNDEGFGDVELYTEWEEDKMGCYTGKPPEFHLYLNGINEQDVLGWYPQNPFSAGVEFHSFGISKECSIHETDIKLNSCFDVYNKCLENKKWIDWSNDKMAKLNELTQEYVRYRNEQYRKDKEDADR